jgi:hypothetical protein
MRFICSIGSAVALAVLTASHSPAQQPPPAQPPAQPKASPTPGYYPTPLYNMNDVAKTININDKQMSQLNEVNQGVQGRFRADYEKLATLPDKERFARTQELNRLYNTESMKGMGNVLSPEQLARYEQLQLQYNGFNSLADPGVQKRLNLSEQQLKQLGNSVDWSNQQMQEINQLATTDPDKAMQQYRDYQKTNQSRFKQYLTADQQRLWTSLTGDPYQFQPAFTPSRPQR